LRKLFALYTNEMIKTSRKISIIIIMIIMVVIVAGVGGLVKFAEYESSKYAVNNPNGTDWQTQNMNQQLTSFNTQLADVNIKLKTASTQDQQTLKSQQDGLQQQINMYQDAIDQGVVINSSDYRSKAFSQLYQYKSDAAQFVSIPDASMTIDMKNQLAQDNKYITTLQNVIKSKDFSGYINFSNDLINSDKTLSQDEKQIYIKSNDMRFNLNPKGETVINLAGNDVSDQMVTTIQNDSLSLLNNIDMTGTQAQIPLTSQRRDDITNDIAVNTYKLDNNIGFTQSGTIDYKSTAMPAMFGFGGILLIILMLILAGSSVSQEISTGSIKSLIIAPVRRGKIYTAKFLSLLTVLIASGLVVYLVATVTCGAFFGFNSGTPYIFAINGTVHVMNFYIYNLAYFYAGLIEVFVYTVFAFMLSIITRNTAASVGISIAVYFGGSIATSLLLTFAKGEWLKFWPFNNMNIASKIFPGAAAQMTGLSIGGSTGIASTVSNSLTFSLCYLAVLLLCMGYIAFDSFTRRDIK
jgi:ABC-2 type transport system permease protein